MNLAWGQSISHGRGWVSIMWLAMTVHLGRGDLGISYGLFLKTWIHSHNIYSVVHTTLNARAALGDKLWCMSYICVFFYRYANHVYVSHTTGTNYGDECNLPPIIHTPYTLGKLFLLVRTYRTGILSWSCICICINNMNFENHLI
jgi:hypothetical protein